MAAHHAACRARRVKQNGVEGLAVPPACRVAGVSRSNVGLEFESVESLANLDGSGGIDLQRSHGAVRALENVGGLAAGSRAGVQHPVARLHGQQMRGKLRSCILNGAQPVGKAGNAVDGDGRAEFLSAPSRPSGRASSPAAFSRSR